MATDIIHATSLTLYAFWVTPSQPPIADVICACPSQLSAIKRMTLSRLLCDYADDPSEMKLPRDMFRVVTDNKGDNPLLSCRDTVNIPALDLEAWR